MFLSKAIIQNSPIKSREITQNHNIFNLSHAPFLEWTHACKKHFISAGILGTIMGIIILLANLESSEAMGKGVAFALLSVFYGVVLYCISDALVTGAREVL